MGRSATQLIRVALACATMVAGVCLSVADGAWATSPPTVSRGVDAAAPLDGRVVVSPVRFDLGEVAAGSSHQQTLRVLNRTESAVALSVAARGVVAPDGPDQPTVVVLGPNDPAAIDTAAPWLDIGLTDAELEPRAWIELPVEVVVPATAPPGGRFAAVVVTAEPAGADDDAAGTDVGVVPEIAVLVLATIEGEYESNVRLEGVDAPRLVMGRSPWRLTASLSNKGDTYARYVGTARVAGIAGRTVAELELNSRIMLPGAERAVSANWDQPPWLGFYRVEGRLDPSSGPGAKELRFSTWFIALPPWWLIAAVLIACAAWIWWRRRRRHAWTTYFADDEIDQ